MTELQPDVHDVLQEEDVAAQSVPVCVVDQRAPLRTQALPRKGGATFTRTAPAASGAVRNVARLLLADHRRASARLVSTQPFLVAFTETAAQDDSTMCLWPAAQPFVHTATTDVWVGTPVAGTPGVIGVTTELWAEGE